MKYIKKFENSKKYILLEYGYIYLIIEIININNNIIFKKLYSFNPSQVSWSTGKLGSISKIDDDKRYSISTIDIKDRILYQTDNLNDLLDEDFLRIIKDINKYNL